jgi:hypothetical protein
VPNTVGRQGGVRQWPDSLMVGDCRGAELVDLLIVGAFVRQPPVGRQWIIQLRSQLFSGSFSNAPKSSAERLRKYAESERIKQL